MLALPAATYLTHWWLGFNCHNTIRSHKARLCCLLSPLWPTRRQQMRLQTNMIPNSCFPITVQILLHLCSSQEISCSLFNVTDFFFIIIIKTQGTAEESETKCFISNKIKFQKKYVYIYLELLKCQVFCTNVFVMKLLYFFGF